MDENEGLLFIWGTTKELMIKEMLGIHFIDTSSCTDVLLLKEWWISMSSNTTRNALMVLVN
jgi:hypothetical protein